VAYLGQHFPENPRDDVRVIVHRRKLLSKFIVHILDIRKINIHQTPDLPQRIHRIITVRVVHDGNNESLALGHPNGLGYLKNHVGRRDKIDIMSASILKAQHFRHQFVCSQSPGAACLKFLADLVILAEYTAQVASGEKDGPGTSRSRNGGFFSKM
jgi:hypothetical protein